MAEKVTITISSAVAAFVRPGTPPETRLAGCSAAGSMAPADQFMLLFCLLKDEDTHIRATAGASLQNIPEAVIREYLDSVAPHPLILKAVAQLCRHYPEAVVAADTTPFIDDDASEIAPAEAVSAEKAAEGDTVINEESEEFLSKYKMAQIMGIAEKIKTALSGDKEWRAILVKDANKLVSGSVIKNPRITEAEVLALVKSGIQNDEIMRLICANKEWIKNYSIRKALIENSRTPVQNAMRYLGTMGEKDLSSFAKSKNVASVISTTAKRLLLNKKK